MKSLLLTIFFFVTLTTASFSQLKESQSLFGPSVGFWFYSSVPTFGANYEYQVSQLGETGTFGLGGIFRYTSYTDSYTYGDWTYSYITLGAQGNINFNKIGDGKFVPFIGLVLGYNTVNVSSTYTGTFYSATATSGLWMWGQGGLRYFVSPNVAIGARFGAGNYNYYTSEFSVDFKF